MSNQFKEWARSAHLVEHTPEMQLAMEAYNQALEDAAVTADGVAKWFANDKHIGSKNADKGAIHAASAIRKLKSN